MALTLSQLVNDYGSYSGNRLTGLYGASSQVPNRGFGDVTGVPYDNITFIIKVNGKKYASSKWLSQQQNGNPYLASNTVARIDTANIPLAPIDSVSFLDQDGERYSEMKATSKLDNDTPRLQFITDLLSSNDEIKPASAWGSWNGNVQRTVTVPTPIEDPLGNTYEIGVVGSKFGNTYNADIDLEGVYPGLEFEGTGFNGKQIKIDDPVSVIEEEVVESSVDTGSDLVDINFDDFELDPIDINFDDIVIGPIDFDFGFGDINTDFGFGLGGDVSVGGTNQFTSTNSAGDDFTTRSSTGYGGTLNDNNDFNEPEVFGSFGGLQY